jgi:hypothetical protein
VAKEHVFLGMNFVFNANETVSISMASYLEEAITESKLLINKVSTSPANKNLFDVDTNSKQLPKTESEIFHSVVAKLLYVGTSRMP